MLVYLYYVLFYFLYTKKGVYLCESLCVQWIYDDEDEDVADDDHDVIHDVDHYDDDDDDDDDAYDL